jgi:hypothetical protein
VLPRRPGATRWLDEILDGTAEIPDQIEDGALQFSGEVAHKTARQLRNNRRLLTEAS